MIPAPWRNAGEVSMQYSGICYTVDEGIARISLNDPATLNAVTSAMGKELLHAIMRAGDEARALVITGEGRAFSSGANLNGDDLQHDDDRRDVGNTLDGIFNPVVVQMKRLAIPVITSVRGAAAGVGCAIALAGDIIVCAENAYFLQAFCRIGLSVDGGSSWLLSRAAGRVRAMEMMLLGEKLPAAKALEWGLVTRVVPEVDLDGETQAMARRLANGPRSLGIIKRMAWLAADTSLEQALSEERMGQLEAGRTADFIEGVDAFLGKRTPVFTGA
jgi:2-(1,2-epoxy-1,2-dihydrophenyl)acetyl-CoA isomerase